MYIRYIVWCLYLVDIEWVIRWMKRENELKNWILMRIFNSFMSMLMIV